MPTRNDGSAFADDSVRATLEVAGQEFPDIEQYSYNSDILQLGDPFSVKLANIEGQHNGKINLGDLTRLYLEDPAVAGGSRVQKVTGRVTGIDDDEDIRSGQTLQITGADLGWHLVSDSGPLWFNLKGVTFNKFLAKVLDPSWGLDPTALRNDNEFNRAFKQGRQGKTVVIHPVFGAVIPPIQIESGEMIADVLIRYAKRIQRLVNVSADGVLQIFKPGYGQATSYSFHRHKSFSPDRRLNNVIRAHRKQVIDTVYTDVICVGTKVQAEPVRDSDDPHEGHFRGFAHSLTLPFRRRFNFSDGEPLQRKEATARAQWRIDRGLFDSHTIEYTVRGHSQGGIFYEPDTMAEVHDDAFGEHGSFYVSAVQYTRTIREGTITKLTLKKPNLLAAF